MKCCSTARTQNDGRDEAPTDFPNFCDHEVGLANSDELLLEISRDRSFVDDLEGFAVAIGKGGERGYTGVAVFGKLPHRSGGGIDDQEPKEAAGRNNVTKIPPVEVSTQRHGLGG